MVTGIDLGTTFSAVGVMRGGKVDIIANDQGSIDYSLLCSIYKRRTINWRFSKNQAALNSTNTIFDAKRLIGKRFDDKQVQNDMKHWPLR